MKTKNNILFALLLFITAFCFSQTQEIDGKLKVNQLPAAAATDSILAVDASGLFKRVAGQVQNISLFNSFVPDSYLGQRYRFNDVSVNGFYWGNSENERNGITVYNDGTGNAAVASFVVSNNSAAYTQSAALQYFGNNYFGVPFRNKGGLFTDTGLVFIGAFGAPFEFYSVPDGNYAGMVQTPALDMDPLDWTWRSRRATIAALDAGDSRSLVTKEWVTDKALFGSPFSDQFTSNPSDDTTTAIFRQGAIGLGNTMSPEFFEVNGTESLTSGIKFANNYTDGSVLRLQFGGKNIGSELGIPANGVKGFYTGYLGDTNYPNQQLVMMGGNFLLAGAQKNYGWTIGNFSTSGANYSAMFTEPFFSNDENDFLFKAKAVNGDGDHAHIHAKTVGYETQTTAIKDYGEEALVELNAENTQGDQNRLYVSPHFTEINKILRFDTGYSDDTFVPGYTHTDDVLKTGTAATTLGIPVAAISIDATGHGVVSTAIISDSVDLTEAQIETLNSSPVEIIVNPGPGFAIEVMSASFNYTFNTTAFDFAASDERLMIKASSGSLPVLAQKATSPFYPTEDLNAATSYFETLIPSGGTIVPNSAIVVYAESDTATTNGDGSGTIYFSYKIIKL